MGRDEQAALAKLSVFRGGFSREAAQQVAGANLRVLLSLVNKSLVRRQAESGRFSLHELLRQFAFMKLQQTGEETAVSLAHCHYFASLIAWETEQAINLYPMHIYRYLLADRDNVRIAWESAYKYGLAQVLRDMCLGIVVFSFAQGILPKKLLNPAIAALKEQGFPDSDASLLFLSLIQINSQVEQEAHHIIRPQMLAMLSRIEAHSDLLLRYWSYDCFAFLDIDNDMTNAFISQEKAYHIARKLNAAPLIKRIQVLTIWFGLESEGLEHVSLAQLRDLPDVSRLEQLESLLAYFEKDYPISFPLFAVLMSLCVHCLENGLIDKAIQYGQRGLNLTKEWFDLYWISFASDRLADIYLKVGSISQAQAQLLDCLEWHIAIGQTWKTLGFLWSKTVRFPQIFAREDLVIPINSMVFHHPEATPYYRQEIERETEMMKLEIGETLFSRAWEEGKRFDYETAVGMVRGALSVADS